MSFIVRPAAKMSWAYQIDQLWQAQAKLHQHRLSVIANRSD